MSVRVEMKSKYRELLDKIFFQKSLEMTLKNNTL